MRERIPGASGRRKPEARPQTLRDFVRGEKNVKGKEKNRRPDVSDYGEGVGGGWGREQRTEREAFGMDGAKFGEGGCWRWEETQQGKMQAMRLL